MLRPRTSSGVALLVLCICSADVTSALAATNFSLSQATGGIAVTASGQNYRSVFGTVDALGINTGGAGLTRIATNTGTIYYSAYQIGLKKNAVPAGHHAYLTAYVSTNFAHPAALALYTCSASCTTAGAFSAMSTNSAAQSAIIPSPGFTTAAAVTTSASIAVWVPDNDGASAFTGNDSVIATYTLRDFEAGTTVETAQWQFNTPQGATLQSAVRMTLAKNASGVNIVTTGGTPDYTLNFGNVNGLGIAPAAGLTATAVSGGFMYTTPYDVSTAFSDLAATTATIRVVLTTNFAHPAVLKLNDAGAAAGPFTQITTTAIQITSTAADRGTFTRYLGLFVSNVNGAGAFTGADTATITYTMVVP